MNSSGTLTTSRHNTPRGTEPAIDGTLRPRRVLLVSYHFPPSTAIGALRWEKLAHALAGRGYAVDVLSLNPSQLERRDNARVDALPANVRIFGVTHRIPVLEWAWNRLAALTKDMRRASAQGHVSSAPPSPTETAATVVGGRSSLMGNIRRMVNARLHVANELSWARAAAQKGINMATTDRYDAVITSGPPHYVHVAGRLIHERTGIPHIADFRDPWRLAESVARDMSATTLQALADRYETGVVAKANKVIMNTETAARSMRGRYPNFAGKIAAIMNGSDPEDRVESPPRDRFTLLYAGTLYLQRDPRVVFQACAPLVAELGLTPSQFGVDFLGPSDVYNGQRVLDVAAEYGLRDHVRMGGLLPRRTALERAALATHLVCLPDGQRLTIQAKLFEYVQLDCWLLVFAEPDSAMAAALEGTDADVVAPSDVQRAAALVRNRWFQFATGKRPTAIGNDGRFLRSTQAEHLCALLDALPTQRDRQ